MLFRSLGGTPVYVIPIGNTQYVRDILVQSVFCPAVAMRNDDIVIEAVIQAYECEGETCVVQLLQDGNAVESRTVQLDSGFATRRVRFDQKMSDVGVQRFQVSVSGVAKELTEQNNVDDFEAIAKVAHDAGIPFVIDNTVTTPYLFRPFQHGADIIVYSLTKFIGGHGTSIGGAVVDGGTFPWNNGKFPELAGPDPSYHGLNYWEALGNLSYILKMRLTILRDMGACISPFNSFQIIQGVETLHLRMQRHVENSQKVAEWLEKHPLVSWVNYPGLASHPDHARAKKYLPKGAGAIIGFGIKGGMEAGKKFIDNVKLLSHLANIGDAKSLVIHPASTTHQQLSPEEQISTGVTADFIRLSVGLEDVRDIIADLEQALKAAQ